MILFANVGIPMLFVGLPFMAIVLAPVILIEGVWYWRFLHLPWFKAWRGSLRANIQSTLLGLPGAWLLWVVVGRMSVALAFADGLFTREQFLESYTVGFLVLVGTAGWLDPIQGSEDGLLLGAGLVLLLPAYLVSYLWESRLLRSEWPELAAAEIGRQVWRAHLLSYGLLYAVAGVRFYYVAWSPP